MSGWEIFGMVAAGLIVLYCLVYVVLGLIDLPRFLKISRM
jgi:hypothetical protein